MPIKSKKLKDTSSMKIESELHHLTTQQVQQFSGPLPPPEILKSYEEITSGFADRIIGMAESEIAHRRDGKRYVKGGY